MMCRVGGMVCAAVLLLCSRAHSAEPGRIVFPDDVSVLDARRDLGAVGDGVADDTAALQRGLDSNSHEALRTHVLYLPNGTYKVSKSLIVNHPLGPWLYGETRDGVVIRLADGAAGVTAVLRTHPREGGPNSADWFMRNVRNLTIDAGDNPEADGIRWFSTNTGCLQNVRVIGNGKVGINAGFLDQSGPNLIQDCVVEGFETGVLSQWIWGETLSRITVRNCRSVGVVVSANSAAIEGLVVEGTPQALRILTPEDWGHWCGVVALLGGTFRGGDPNLPAIQNDGVLYARNVAAKGFSQAIVSSGPSPSPDGDRIAEFISHPVKSLFPAGEAKEAAPVAPPLEIRREPEVPWELDLDKWLCVDEFGATSNDDRDDTAAIQKAMDAAAAAGKSTVYFRGCGGPEPNWYSVEGEIRVPGGVRWVLGLGWARILGGEQGRFVVTDDSADVVKFQNLDAFGGPPVWLENRSQSKSMCVESCGVRILGAGAGDIFATDCPAAVDLRSPGQHMWCRHLNPEGESDEGLVRNAGADLWMLGVKFEGRGVRIRTTDGGRTEAYGVFNYGPGIDEGDRRPMFEVRDAGFAVYGLRELSFGGNCYRSKVRESQAGETRSLDDDVESGWIGWAAYRSLAPRAK